MKKKFIFDEKKGTVSRKGKLKDVLANLSFGAVNKMCDLALLVLIFGEASITSGGLAKNFARNTARLWEEYPGVDVKSWLEGFRTVRKKRWVDGSFELTEEGKKRLLGIVPIEQEKRRWDGNWYIVIFDIPENLRKSRDILRYTLQTIGFGKLQKSIWISPFNFLGTIQQEVEKLGLGSFVFCAQTAKLGEANSKELAERVWKLGELRAQYAALLESIASKKAKNPKHAFFRYLFILRQDPRLPQELLPDDWPGNEADKYMKYFLAKQGGEKFKFWGEYFIPRS